MSGLKSAVLNYRPPKPVLHMSMLAHKSTKKKPVGFAGGNNKLREVFNNADYVIDESDDESTDSNALNILKSAPKPRRIQPIQQIIYITDNVKLRGSVVAQAKEPESDSVEESSIDESRDGEDMTRFCKRINKMTLYQMRIDQKKQNDRAAKKLSAQETLKKIIMNDFRKKVKDNLYKGKMILYEYEKDQMIGNYSIYETLMSPMGNSLLKQITEEVLPFRLFHYSDGNYKIEITWAAPSIKDPTGPTNRIEKVKKISGPPPPPHLL